MIFTYPAFIHNDTDGLWIEFVDFNCTTHADNLPDLMLYAKEAMECHLLGLMECGEKLPKASIIYNKPNITFIQSDIDLISESTPVEKSCFIPEWLNRQALAKNLNFSKILQDGLIAKLQRV